MHQNYTTGDLLSYWVVRVHDPKTDSFVEVFKSYGQNVANERVIEFLRNGVCAVVEHKCLPMI